MEKPFTIKINEFSENLIKLVNSSKLPAYVLKNEIEKVYAELNRVDEEEMIKYNKSLSNENNQKNSKERTDENGKNKFWKQR